MGVTASKGVQARGSPALYRRKSGSERPVGPGTNYGFAGVRTWHAPDGREFGTIKPVTVKFWPWLEPFSERTCLIHAC